MADDPGAQRPTLPDIPATGWAVLGMLSFNEEVSGYDVKRWADWSVSHFYWSPSFSQVYSELKRLEKLGLATSRTERSAGERSRRLYAITDDGHAALTEWAMTAPVDLPMLKHPVILRVWLGHVNSADRLRAILTEYIEQLESMIREVDRDARLSVEEPAWAYPRLSLMWAQHHYRAELEMAQKLIVELDATAEAVKPAIDDAGRLIPPPPGRWQHVSTMLPEND